MSERATSTAPNGGNGRTGGSSGSDLPTVRRVEALGFRAWPAANSLYDGSWLVRLTAGHPSRRLNSVNPLDRMDDGDLDTRIARITDRFSAYDRGVVFRQTPLSPPKLAGWLDEREWVTEGETRIMLASTDELGLDDAREQIPLQDIGTFVEAALAVRGRGRSLKGGLTEVLTAIRPRRGMFVVSEGEEPVATALCVHDGEYAGIFEVATRPDRRRRGLARTVTRAALRWARDNGAQRAWLQVESDNDAALALYGGQGFREAYRYHYRAAPDSGGRLSLNEELI